MQAKKKLEFNNTIIEKINKCKQNNKKTENYKKNIRKK